ncbi:MAG: hypothetical protein QMC23_04175 [Rubritalea sp.]
MITPPLSLSPISPTTSSGTAPKKQIPSNDSGYLAIHGGGEGKKTWTGITFQVADVVAGATEIIANGGKCEREPQPEDGEPPHLAMREDTNGNQIMLSRARS